MIRPALDRRLFQPESRQSALAVAYVVTLYAGGLAGAAYLLTQASVVALLACVPAALAAFGLFLHGVLGHEGFHFNLARDRLASCTLGVLVSSVLSGFCVTGYAVDHWSHHRLNNASNDPDLRLFSRYRGLFGRLVLSRLAATARYACLTARLAAGDHTLAAAVPIKPASLITLARLNLMTQTGWIILHLIAAQRFPGLLIAWPLCLMMVVLISGLNSYQEHAFTQEQPNVPARSRSSVICSLLYMGSNFHLEHHLYPGIACWRLPGVHRQLQAAGWYSDKSHWVETGFFHSFRFAQRRYAYAPKRIGDTPPVPSTHDNIQGNDHVT